MNKLKMSTPDVTEDNIAKIRTLFPGCVTEARGEHGQLRHVIDFDLLKQELSDHIVDGAQERYHLNWPGKGEALLAANTPIGKTLRPCREESVEFETTQNLFIEGDNLDALKLLQETYLGKVKLIYIDPPYNTGKDFIYKDNFRQGEERYLQSSDQRDEQGNRLVANSESNGRFHSDWLSMMYPRLKLARNLLKEDGVIVLSIDDAENHNLKELANELFGDANDLGTIVWKKKTNGNNMGHIPAVHDYFLVYAKSATNEVVKGFRISQEHISNSYKNPDDDPRGPWTTSDLSANHVGPYFTITNPDTGEGFLPPKGRYWVFGPEEVEKRIREGRIIFGKSGSGRPIQKKFLSERISMRRKAESWWDKHGLNQDGTAEISELLGPKVFTHPKPSITLKHISDITTSEDDIVFDFFAGSASTAQAVMQLNAEDGGNRRVILVQIPEVCDESSEAFKTGYSTIAEIAKERIRRAGKKILQGDCHEDWNQDIGFRVLKIDSSNMEDVFYTPDALSQELLAHTADNIKSDRTPEDLLFQVLLDWGVDLSLPVRSENIQNHTVFFVDENALVACFDDEVTEDLVKELATYGPLRVVFKDSAFASDAVKINVEQVVKQLAPGTEMRVL